MKENLEFTGKVWQYYKDHKRPMPWRETQNGYEIFVSEVMLQQTQVPRVLIKYPIFLAAFPTVQALAEASTKALLAAWQGLGYNRRALLLREAARAIVNDHGGVVPDSVKELDALPGIGYATASSIAAFAYNEPTVFIETNIRAVFIHEFFPRAQKVSDEKIVPLVTKTLDTKNPREWYYALMDYGAFLKKHFKNPARKSLHHAKQSTFEGSDRQIRGAVLRELLKGGARTRAGLVKTLKCDPARLYRITQNMESEGFLKSRGMRLEIR